MTELSNVEPQNKTEETPTTSPTIQRKGWPKGKKRGVKKPAPVSAPKPPKPPVKAEAESSLYDGSPGADVESAPGFDESAFTDPGKFAASLDDNETPSKLRVPWHNDFRFRHLLQARWFRQDEVASWNGGRDAPNGYWQVVIGRPGRNTCGIEHTQMFGVPGDPFATYYDADGRITAGRADPNGYGQLVRELVLCIRPIGAMYFEAKIIAAQQEKALNVSGDKLAAQAGKTSVNDETGRPLVSPMSMSVTVGPETPGTITSQGWQQLQPTAPAQTAHR